VVIRAGDILCLRTGWLERFMSLDARDRQLMAESGQSPGIQGTSDMAALLWDWGVAAVVADNPAVESLPRLAGVGSLHQRLIPLLGIPLGELFDFESLAVELSARSRSDFAFVSVPLNLPGGVASTGNAVAVL
jgi:hypothetical protein